MEYIVTIGKSALFRRSDDIYTVISEEGKGKWRLGKGILSYEDTLFIKRFFRDGIQLYGWNYSKNSETNKLDSFHIIREEDLEFIPYIEGRMDIFSKLDDLMKKLEQNEVYK